MLQKLVPIKGPYATLIVQEVHIVPQEANLGSVAFLGKAINIGHQGQFWVIFNLKNGNTVVHWEEQEEGILDGYKRTAERRPLVVVNELGIQVDRVLNTL